MTWLMIKVVKFYIRHLRRERNYWDNDAVKYHYELMHAADRVITKEQSDQAIEQYHAKSEELSILIRAASRFLKIIDPPQPPNNDL